MLKKLVVVTGSIAMLSLAAPAAHADTTAGNNGVLTGNQVHVPVNAPIDVCGNAISVVGVLPIAGCRGGAGVYAPSKH
ncbi:chaplin [Nonomuraea jiangxiensis]|uniref:Small secreted domain n=1 Tax=Nonomuraea jiangxiensis TaxID=633440 RepID=A0A1G8XQ38_9ACTN|nr:chaplin [Nonomuraea jiangxiensis]SDJ91890.1 Small secreted domain [Nonomuraea jiangxiensis]